VVPFRFRSGVGIAVYLWNFDRLEAQVPKSGHGAPGFVEDWIENGFLFRLLKNKGIAMSDAVGLSPLSCDFPKQQVYQMDQMDQVEQVEQVDQGALVCQ
jgi:hypothetical protein